MKTMNPTFSKKTIFFKWISFLLVLSVLLSFSSPAMAELQPAPKPASSKSLPASHLQYTDSTDKATADPDAPHETYDWPLQWEQIAHNNASYQNYDPDNIDYAYFHHGVDFLVSEPLRKIYTRSGGQVVNVQNYFEGKWYWEVGILDPQGYVWQYHHVDPESIPQAIKDAHTAYLANPATGGFVPPNTYLGGVIDWEGEALGYDGHHLHLNIIAAGGVYLNPFEFHKVGTYVDDQAPIIHKIGLLKDNQLLPGNTIAPNTNYSIYMKASDLYRSPVFILPPHSIDIKIDGADEWTNVWTFRKLPGENDFMAYLHDFYVPYVTRGTPAVREFYFNLGFVKDGQRSFPKTSGTHTIDVRIADYAGNSTEQTYTWTVTGGSENRPPIAHGQSLNLALNQAATIILKGEDPDGDALTFKITRQPTNGTLSGTAPNMVYVPKLGFVGEDSFEFVVNDGKVDSEPATIKLTINPNLYMPMVFAFE